MIESGMLLLGLALGLGFYLTERREWRKRESELLDRLMSRNFLEYETGAAVKSRSYGEARTRPIPTLATDRQEAEYMRNLGG